MSTDDPDGKDEPRAKDLFTRPREELEQAMDPATLAQLASWFDMPNLAEAEETAAIAEALSDEDRELEERRKRKAAACAAADPALVARIEAREHARILVMPVFELTPCIDETIVNIAVRAQLERQSAEEPVPDWNEYQQPGDIEEIIARHNAPQAILRDLYRPVTEYEARLESPFDELPEMDPTREVREALRERIKTELAEPTFQVGSEAHAELKKILSEPWVSHWEVVQEIATERRSRETKLL